MSECVKCGKAFGCGMVDAASASPCWCTQLPPLPAGLLGRDARGCYCPGCLRRLLDDAGARLMGSDAA